MEDFGLISKQGYNPDRYKRKFPRLNSALVLLLVWVASLALMVFINKRYVDQLLTVFINYSKTQRYEIDQSETETSRPYMNHTEMSCRTGIRMPAGIPRDTFQHVQGSDIYVYSAYLDRRVAQHHQVRIIGISPIDPGPVSCEFYYQNGRVFSTPATIILSSVDLKLHRNFKFKPYLFMCNESTGNNVKVVSLTTVPCGIPSNMLSVTTISVKSENDIKNSVAVCLRTIHHVHSPYIVVEFIEMQRFLGASHFYVYGAEDISQPVQRVLDYYIILGILTIYPWHLPVKNSPVFDKPGDIAIHGQHALNNDCLYRTMNTHRLVYMHDMDEYIIPRHPHIFSTLQLVKQVLSQKKLKPTVQYASFSFMNCYFCLESNDYTDLEPQLLTLKRNIRHVCLGPEMSKAWKKDPKQRHIEGGRGAAKKTLIYPLRVIQMGVHGVITSIPGYEKELKVSTFYATMHHYKRPVDIPCNVKDNTLISKYKTSLKSKVNSVCKEIGLDTVT